MKISTLLLKSCTALFLALALSASAAARDSVIVKMTGPVEIQVPGESAFKPLTMGMPVPEKSTIRTGPGAEVFLEVVIGVVATIKADTTVLVEENIVRQEGGRDVADATLDVKGGAVVSTLNPRLKEQNRYKVRTPLGVAAARGTVFAVRVVAATGATSVGTMAGTIIMTVSAPGGGTREVSIPFGNAITTAAGQAALAQAAAQNPNLAQDIADAVKIVADNVKASTTAVDTAADATATLAAVVSAATAVSPSQAASFVETAVAAVVSNTSPTGKSAGDTNAAVSAITESAVRAAPEQTQNIVTKAAETVVEVKVTEAVAQARATGGDANAAATSATAAAKSTLDSVAQGATSGSGGSVDATAISNAVNSGASTGTSNAASSTGTTPPPPPSVSPPTVPVTSTPITTPSVDIDVRPVSPSGGTP